MKVLSLIVFCFFFIFSAKAQIPKDGIYTYKIAFEEWNGKSAGVTCTVKIQGDSIFIIHNGSGNLTGKKGDILDKGIIVKHAQTGKFIIAKHRNDADAKEIGACGNSPAVIDFVKKIYWSC